jgi:hypothetical protein
MKHLALIAMLTLAACGNGAKFATPGDLADAATTVHVIASPAFSEINPLVPNDPIVGPIVLLGQKYIVKAGLIELGYSPEFSNKFVDVWAGWSVFAHNMVFFAIESHPAGLLAGGLLGLFLWETTE